MKRTKWWMTPALMLMLAGWMVTELQAQDLHSSRRLSPVGIAKTFLGDTYVKVTHGRPYMRGRTIFGDGEGDDAPLIPYGQLWRTGANEATEITVTGPVMLDGKRLEAGTYALFAIPGPETWALHVSPFLGLDGTGRLGPDGFVPDVYDSAHDVLVASGMVQQREEPTDPFTITFEEADGMMYLSLLWDTTAVMVPISAAE